MSSLLSFSFRSSNSSRRCCSHSSILFVRNNCHHQYHGSIYLRQRQRQRRRQQQRFFLNHISSRAGLCSSSSPSTSSSLSSSSRIDRTTSNRHSHIIHAAPPYFLSSSLLSSHHHKKKPPLSLSKIRFCTSNSNKEDKEDTPTTKNTTTTHHNVINTTSTQNSVDDTNTAAAATTDTTNDDDNHNDTTGVNGGGGGGISFQDEFDYPFPILQERSVYDIAYSACNGFFQLMVSQDSKNQFVQAMNNEPRIIHPLFSRGRNGLLLSIALYYDLYHNPLWQKTVVDMTTKNNINTNTTAKAPIINKNEENEKKNDNDDNQINNITNNNDNNDATIKSENLDKLSSSSSKAEEEMNKNDEESTIEPSSTAAEEEEEEEETRRVVNLFDPKEFLNGVLPALTSFHNVKELLLNEMIDSDHYSNLSLEERTTSLQKTLNYNNGNVAVTAGVQDASINAERIKNELVGENDGNKNEWIVEAEMEETSLAGTLMKMVTHDVYNDTHKNAKMDALESVVYAHVNYVKDSTKIQHVALLSARCFEIPIQQNLVNDLKEEKHNDGDEITSPIIAAQIEVLYDVKQTYLKRYDNNNNTHILEKERKMTEKEHNEEYEYIIENVKKNIKIAEALQEEHLKLQTKDTPKGNRKDDLDTIMQQCKNTVIESKTDVILYDVKQTYLKRNDTKHHILNQDTQREKRIRIEEGENEEEENKTLIENIRKNIKLAEKEEENIRKRNTNNNENSINDDDTISKESGKKVNHTIIEATTMKKDNENNSHSTKEEDVTIIAKKKNDDDDNTATANPKTDTTESETQLLVCTFIGYLDGSPIDNGQLRWKIAKMRTPYEEFPDLYDDEAT